MRAARALAVCLFFSVGCSGQEDAAADDKSAGEPSDETEISTPLAGFLYDGAFLTTVDGLFTDAVIEASLQGSGQAPEQRLAPGSLSDEVYRSNTRLGAVRKTLRDVAARLEATFGKGRPLDSRRKLKFRIANGVGRALYEIPPAGIVAKGATTAYAQLEFRSTAGAPRMLSIFERVGTKLRWSMDVRVTSLEGKTDDLVVRFIERGVRPEPGAMLVGEDQRPALDGIVEVSMRPAARSLTYVRTLTSFDVPIVDSMPIPAYDATRLVFADDVFHLLMSVRDVADAVEAPPSILPDFHFSKRRSGDVMISEMVAPRAEGAISVQRSAFVPKADAARFVAANGDPFGLFGLETYGAKVFRELFGNAATNPACSTMGQDLKRAFGEFPYPTAWADAYARAKSVVDKAPADLCGKPEFLVVADAVCRFVDFFFPTPALQSDLCRDAYRALIVELRPGIGTVVADGVRSLVHSSDGAYYDDAPGTAAHAALRAKFYAPSELAFPELAAFEPLFAEPSVAFDPKDAEKLDAVD